MEEVEQRRLFPWLAVSFGLGILGFFATGTPPGLWVSLGGSAVGSAAALAGRRHLAVCAAALAGAAACAGFAAATIRTWSVATPVIARTIIAPVSAFVEEVDRRPDGARLTLRVHAVGGLTAAEVPYRVRVGIRKAVPLAAGDFIIASARLLPPPEAALPGGFDFARDSFFRRIGAVGSLVGPVTVHPPPEAPSFGLVLSAAIDQARNRLTEQIAQTIDGPAGAVAAALVTGKRGLIEEDINDALRAAGVYHVVSISGLHMVLAAGMVFWLIRAGLALVPAVALRWPIKKIAAGAGMVGACAYCAFSGSEVATERSLVMTLVMLGAVLFDRPALSMRNLAVAAVVVLAREPEALLGPSFQMSYGAVGALIASAGLLARPFQGEARAGIAGRLVRWSAQATVGLVGTTLVATLATAPFGAYHFHTLNPFGLLGNALVLPLVSLVVMPAAVLGVVALPFGLDGPVWQVMGLAVGGILTMSKWVSGIHGAMLVVPAFGGDVVALFALALLILMLAASPLRWIGLAPALAGLALAATADRFDIYVDREGAGAAIRGEAGRLVLVGRPSAFVAEQWLRADGDARNPDDETLRDGARCDRGGCVVRSFGGRAVAFVQQRAALEEDCRRAVAVIARMRVGVPCAASVVIDRAALAAAGAHAMRFTQAGAQVVSVRDSGWAKPWLRNPSIASAAKPPTSGPAPGRGPEDGSPALLGAPGPGSP